MGLTVLSCFFSTLPSRSLVQLKGQGTFLILVFTVALLVDGEDVELALDLWRITAAYLVLRGFLEYAAGFDNLEARLKGGMSVHMTYAGLLMVFVFVLGARSLWGAGPRASRVADLLVAGGALVGVGLTLTRNTYLGLAAGAVAVALAVRPKLVLAVPVAAVLLVLALPASVKERALSTLDSKDETARDRLLMWRAGAQMVADRPFFGVGPGRVKELYPVYRLPGFFEPRPGHLHNNVVNTAAETGIPSALAYLAFVAAFFVHAVRRLRTTPPGGPRAVLLGSIGAMTALFVAGMFEYNFGDVEVLMATLVVSALPFAGTRAGEQ